MVESILAVLCKPVFIERLHGFVECRPTGRHGIIEYIVNHAGNATVTVPCRHASSFRSMLLNYGINLKVEARQQFLRGEFGIVVEVRVAIGYCVEKEVVKHEIQAA